VLDDFLKHVGAICRPWQQLTESATNWTTYTRSEQTLISARLRLTPADDRGEITSEIHYGSGKPSPRITHGKRDETSDQTRFKPTDVPSTVPKFAAITTKQIRYILRNNGIPVQAQYTCVTTEFQFKQSIPA
jgi:hypothetical protein